MNTLRPIITTYKYMKPVKVYEPCEPFEPITPNYSYSSLRISEKKCLEYIAKVENHIQEEKWIERCHPSHILQVANVSVLETSVGEPLLRSFHSRNWQGFQNHQICAGELSGSVDTCQGDSGGPILKKMPLEWNVVKTCWILGVASFCIKCGDMNRTFIYTRVSSFIEWIEEVVWEQKK